VALTWTRASTREAYGLDVEARPGPWIGADYTTKKLLSLAGCYEGRPDSMTYLGPGFTARQLERFVTPLREGVMVVTHNGFRYDLPFINGTLVKMRLNPLPPLLVHDTYHHLVKRGSAFSGSLGNLAARYGVTAKGSMGEFMWERVYERDKDALAALKVYNEGDVTATLELRRVLMDAGVLRPPTWWRP
jgi:uncharacterized protein YprB with RNaseH-like and TPR domain